MANVILDKVYKRYGKTEVIHGVDLEIKDQEFVVFVGPSGCGKSTLLRLISGLEDITEGQMSIDGDVVNDVPPSKRGIAMVFQSYALYPHMTSRENMAFGLKLAKKDPQTINEQVENAAKILQITDLLDRKPKDMSGGQRQRVAIGRAIVRNPKVFLFDEPLSNLDAKLRVQMRLEIAKLHRELDATMVYVTHDQVEAMTMADKIVVLRSGYIEQVGAPMELYHRPRNKFVGGFIGSPSMNFIETKISAVEKGEALVSLPSGDGLKVKITRDTPVGSSVSLGIRPEHCTIGGKSKTQIKGTVEVVENLGGGSYAYVRYGQGQEDLLVVLTEGDTFLKGGEDVSVAVWSDKVHLFDEDEQALSEGTGKK